MDLTNSDLGKQVVGLVIAYDVACNSCSICNQHFNALEDGTLSQEDYDEWHSRHNDVCPAKYSGVSSVCLESELAPKILSQALHRGILFTGIVSDGDSKAYTKIIQADLYRDHNWNANVERYECLAHVLKRMKTHLIEEQKKVLRHNRFSKKIQKEILLQQGQKKKTLTETSKPNFLAS